MPADCSIALICAAPTKRLTERHMPLHNSAESKEIQPPMVLMTCVGM